MSWQQYRVTSRILRAMAILAESDRTVLDVAVEVGFDSLSGFNRVFLRLCGETPSVYRRGSPTRLTHARCRVLTAIPSARVRGSTPPLGP